MGVRFGETEYGGVRYDCNINVSQLANIPRQICFKVLKARPFASFPDHWEISESFHLVKRIDWEIAG